MGRTKQQTKLTFSQKLKAELTGRGMGNRTLARVIVDAEPAVDNRERRVDNVRRQIRDHLSGVTPTARSRHTYEDALGLERDSLKGDDEEEGSRLRRLPSPARQMDMVVDLIAQAVFAKMDAASEAVEELQES